MHAWYLVYARGNGQGKRREIEIEMTLNRREIARLLSKAYARHLANSLPPGTMSTYGCLLESRRLYAPLVAREVSRPLLRNKHSVASHHVLITAELNRPDCVGCSVSEELLKLSPQWCSGVVEWMMVSTSLYLLLPRVACACATDCACHHVYDRSSVPAHCLAL